MLRIFVFELVVHSQIIRDMGLTLISTPLVRVSVAVQISVQAEKYSCIAAASAQVFVWCSLTRLSCFAEA
jgi:hypothetical protein